MRFPNVRPYALASIGALVTGVAGAAPPSGIQSVQVVNTAPLPVTLAGEVTGSVDATTIGPAIPWQARDVVGMPLNEATHEVCVTVPEGYRFHIQHVTAAAKVAVGQQVLFGTTITLLYDGGGAFADHAMTAELQGNFGGRDTYIANEAMTLYADVLLCGTVSLTEGYTGVGNALFTFSGYLVEE